MIKAVVFDLDNTLTDFMRMKENAVDAAVDAMIDAGLRFSPADIKKKIYDIYEKEGIEFQSVFDHALEELLGQVDFKIHAAGIVGYRRAKEASLVLYPHVKVTLIELMKRGIKLGVVSDAPRKEAWLRLCYLQLHHMFDFVTTFEDTGVRKPSPMPFQRALDFFQLAPREAIMVGDWPERDITGAGQLGMVTVFARYGDTKGAKESGADHEINDVLELVDIVDRLNAGGVMRVLTAEQMQKVDAETIDRVCPGIELMERAGRGVTKAILARHGKQGKAAIFVGPGNNGGDGLVVARLLVEAGWQCSIHLLKTTDLTPDTAANYQRLDKKNIHEYDASRADWPKRAPEDLADATVLVDAIFGTGAKGAPRGRAAEMIALINQTRAARGIPVIAIDIPSGVDGTTAEVPGEAVRASETITIGVPKTGLLFYPGKEHVGALSIIDIGFPKEIVEKHASPWHYLDEEAAASKLPTRPGNIHKYDAGTLVLVAGSDAYRGAALLAGESALRGGCGMVYLAVPEGIRAEISVALREAVTVALPQTPQVTVAKNAAEALKPYLEKANAIAIGPGLGRNEETDAFVRDFVVRAAKPCIIDADGLTAFAGHAKDLAARKAPTVVTPHDGELKRLVSESHATNPVERLEETARIARELKLTLVRKGAPTLIASPDGAVWINASGSSALATGGTGDVLTGLIGSLLAQGAEATDAACVGCFLHGRAGEMAAGEKGVRGVIAGDLIPKLGPAMRSLEALAKPAPADSRPGAPAAGAIHTNFRRRHVPD